MNEPPTLLDRNLAKLSPPQLRSAQAALSLLAGLAVALMLHYLLYRVGLPSKPFIYVAF